MICTEMWWNHALRQRKGCCDCAPGTGRSKGKTHTQSEHLSEKGFFVVNMVCPCFMYLRSSEVTVGRTRWK